MTFTFAILAVVTLAGAIAAMSLRNLVHCALCLVASFGGLAGLFLQLGAQFVGLAQVLVYIGAVAILIVFVILLTRGSEPAQQPILTGRWLMGVAVAALTYGSLMVTIVTSALISPRTGAKPNGGRRYLIKQRERAAYSQLWLFHRIYESMGLGMHPTSSYPRRSRFAPMR